MFRFSFLPRRRGAIQSKSGYGVRTGQRVPENLRVETLEDRLAPAAFLVSNVDDSGPGSLREAILNANANPGADVINFVGNNSVGTINLLSELVITDSVKIHGKGQNRSTIDGGGAVRVFNITTAGIDVEMQHMTIAHGKATGMGGGIRNGGASLTIRHVTFDGNAVGTAVVSAGGAIYNTAAATLSAKHTTFTGNTAAGLIIGAGGAIANDADSTVTVSHSHFSDNHVTQSLAHAIAGAAGGAISNASGGAVNVLHSSFSKNTAEGLAGTALGGAIYNSVATLIVQSSTFTENEAIGLAAGAQAIGGAITNHLPGSIANIADSKFLSNKAVGGGPLVLPGPTVLPGRGLGGALANLPHPPTATGGTMHVSGSTIKGNSATAPVTGGRGGGIFNFLTTITIKTTVITENTAGLGTGGGLGGGIFTFGGSACIDTTDNVFGNSPTDIFGFVAVCS